MPVGHVYRSFRCEPRRVRPGGQVTIFFDVVDADTGALVALATNVILLDGAQVEALASAAATAITTGRYYLLHEIPVTKPTGWWTAILTDNVNGPSVEFKRAFWVEP